MIAADALIIKPGCGLDNQLNIWMGNTEKSSSGVLGSEDIYSIAPMTMSGADSPIALDIARITPVRIPPEAAGKT